MDLDLRFFPQKMKNTQTKPPSGKLMTTFVSETMKKEKGICFMFKCCGLYYEILGRKKDKSNLKNICAFCLKSINYSQIHNLFPCLNWDHVSFRWLALQIFTSLFWWILCSGRVSRFLRPSPVSDLSVRSHVHAHWQFPFLDLLSVSLVCATLV